MANGALAKTIGYERVFDIKAFMQGRHRGKLQVVILTDAQLPRKCANPKCKLGGTVAKGESNRTNLVKDKKGNIRVACIPVQLGMHLQQDLRRTLRQAVLIPLSTVSHQFTESRYEHRT